MALVVSSAGAAAAGAAGLDPSYGSRGVVAVPAPFPGSPRASFGVSSFAATARGDVYVVGRAVDDPCMHGCLGTGYLMRIDADGVRDAAFGGAGAVSLPAKGSYYTGGFTAVADSAGRAVVAAIEGKAVVLRRFTSAGVPDPSFGDGGTVRLGCGCGSVYLRLLAAPTGAIVVDLNHYAERGDSVSRFRLIRVRSNGRPDRRFGRAGAAGFTVDRTGGVRSLIAAPGQAILLGGTSCCGARRPWLVRVTAGGRLDRRFDRRAARSIGRLGALGEIPELTAMVSRPEGGIDALGTWGKQLGFDLRLGADGRLASRFAARGLLRLPVAVGQAVAGTDGAVFVVGAAAPYGGYRAFRILPGGGLDPAYGGTEGLEVPLRGRPIGIARVGDGRVLVTDGGDFWCRSGCSSEPAMARFLE